MLEGKYLLLLCHCRMGVDLRSGYGAVTRYLLDAADIHVLFKEQGGKGMAEHVGSNVYTTSEVSEHISETLAPVANSISNTAISLRPLLCSYSVTALP